MSPGVLSGRPWLVPEVVQTSAMDCGPAVLKCLLAGYGIQAHYGRLREACQADLDGTSIDTLEAVANQLGLKAEQAMLPLDHLLLRDSQTMPAIIVMRQPDGATHFVLLWRRHAGFVQVMDPAIGRRFLTCRQFLDEVYVHHHRVPADSWREWAVSDEMQRPLTTRIRQVGIGYRPAQLLIQSACDSADWRPIAALDASTRLVESLARSGGVRRGRTAGRILRSLFESERGRVIEGTTDQPLIPDPFWSVRPGPTDADGKPQLLLSGSVLVRVSGRDSARQHRMRESLKLAAAKPWNVIADSNEPAPVGRQTSEESSDHSKDHEAPAFGRELAAALTEPDNRPLVELWRFIRGAGRACLAGLFLSLFLMAGAAIGESLVLRGVIDLGRDLALVEQRLVAIGCFVAVGMTTILLEYQIVTSLLQLGRRLETMLRVAFLEKIPRLHDRYFQSRPTSDMAERAHSLYLLRSLPYLAGSFIRSAATLLVTAGVIAWFDPPSVYAAVLTAIVAILLPIAFLPVLAGHDLRVRTHAGALTRFYFDSLLGVAAIRAHGAQRSLRVEHETRLAEWARASERRLRWLIFIDGLQSLTGIGLAGWLLMMHAHRATDVTGVLLIAYWALSFPTLGAEIAASMHEYPTLRNVTLRLLEPLGALESKTTNETVSQDSARLVTDVQPAVAIRLEAVKVRAGGHTILDGVNLNVPAGSHVAIVGVSGAGKSTLAGLLLGWHQSAAGRVLVDGQILSGDQLDRLRGETAWVDPAVQIWNRSLLENFLYGDEFAGLDNIGDIVQQADLYETLQRLPAGLQTQLGEGGGLLSGGEGQRTRFGRALLRRQARLVVLDEPFRGLEREKRRKLLERARHVWQSATLLCVTHDVSETLDFPRVIVLDDGRIVEDGPPHQFAADSASRYRALLDAEADVRRGMWSSPIWRRLELNSGQMIERPVDERPAS